jgi:hypothetical protein
MIRYDAINPTDYALPDGLSDQETTQRLKDPLTRICNLYWIRNAEAQEQKFVPNWAQCVVLHQIYIEKLQRIAIPKARQLGISTLCALIGLDFTLFSKNTTASIVDKTQPDAMNKLKMVRYAYDRLPPALQDAFVEDNNNAMAWVNDSGIYAGKNARGATNNFLHISEFGIIAFNDAARAEEIETGAIPSASGQSAVIVVESTHKGGKGGAWYDMVQLALQVAPEHRTALDFNVTFFPWYLEPRYTLAGDHTQINAEVRKYLVQLEDTIKAKLTPGQKLWYFKKRMSLGRKIYSEYPSTIEECWLAPFPGAIYAPQMDKARGDGRVNDGVLYYEQLPVYTSWDIGAAVNTKVWCFQMVADRINYLECLTGGDDCSHAGEWVKRLKDRTYSYGGHFLPHDAETDYRGQLQRAGLNHTICLPRSTNEWDNINEALGSFNRCHFNLTGCGKGIDSLDAFRSKEESDGQTVRNVPVHDWASHASTAFGYSHQAIKLGWLVDRSAIPSRVKQGANSRESVTGIRSQHGRRSGKATMGLRRRL